MPSLQKSCLTGHQLRKLLVARVGNDSGGECGVAVAKRFVMPDGVTASGPSSNAPFWYGFNYGSVHFTIISTEHDLHKRSPQREVPPDPPVLGSVLGNTCKLKGESWHCASSSDLDHIHGSPMHKQCYYVAVR